MFTRSKLLMFGQSGSASNNEESNFSSITFKIPILVEKGQVYDLDPEKSKDLANKLLSKTQLSWVVLDSLEFEGIFEDNEKRILVGYAGLKEGLTSKDFSNAIETCKDEIYTDLVQCLKRKTRLSHVSKSKILIGNVWAYEVDDGLNN